MARGDRRADRHRPGPRHVPRLVAAVVRAVGDAATEAYVRADPPVAITELIRQAFADVAAGLPEPMRQRSKS